MTESSTVTEGTEPVAEPSPEAKRDLRTWLLRQWRDWFKSFLVIVLFLTMLRSAVADWNDVPSESMKPTILAGDRVFVNKLAYDLKVPFTTWRIVRWSRPKRGDIVVFYSPLDEKRLVKRVVGVPGDTLECRGDVLLINGEPARQEPLSGEILAQVDDPERPQHEFFQEVLGDRPHQIMFTGGKRSDRNFKRLTVPEGMYFVMGDHRDNSLDSRRWGFVEGDRIVGKATAVALSFRSDHYYVPRWSRFFTSLQ